MRGLLRGLESEEEKKEKKKRRRRKREEEKNDPIEIDWEPLKRDSPHRALIRLLFPLLLVTRHALICLYILVTCFAFFLLLFIIFIYIYYV